MTALSANRIPPVTRRGYDGAVTALVGLLLGVEESLANRVQVFGMVQEVPFDESDEVLDSGLAESLSCEGCLGGQHLERGEAARLVPR